MAWTRRQGGGTQIGISQNPQTFSFSLPISSGNIAVGFVWMSTASTSLSSVTDDKSNSYTVTTTTTHMATFYSNAALTNGPITITATLSQADTIWYGIDEMVPPAGTTSVSVEGSGQSSTGSPSGTPTSPSVTASQANDLVYSTGFATTGLTIGAGFASATFVDGTILGTEYLTTSGSGSVTGAWTCPSTSWSCGIVVYKAIGSAVTQNPYTNQWMINVIGAWQPSDLQPILNVKLPPQITAVPPQATTGGILGLAPGVQGSTGTLSAANIIGYAPAVPGTHNLGAAKINGLGPGVPVT